MCPHPPHTHAPRSHTRTRKQGCSGLKILHRGSALGLRRGGRAAAPPLRPAGFLAAADSSPAGALHYSTRTCVCGAVLALAAFACGPCPPTTPVTRVPRGCGFSRRPKFGVWRIAAWPLPAHHPCGQRRCDVHARALDGWSCSPLAPCSWRPVACLRPSEPTSAMATGMNMRDGNAQD